MFFFQCSEQIVLRWDQGGESGDLMFQYSHDFIRPLSMYFYVVLIYPSVLCRDSVEMVHLVCSCVACLVTQIPCHTY